MLYYLFSGITLGLSAGLSPGPLLALVLSETIHHGKKAGIYVAVAPFLTDVPIILVSLLMIDFLSSSNIAFGLLSVVGALYLLWLSRENFQAKTFKVNESGSGKSLKKGILANFLNPAPYLFWISIGSPLMIKGWQVNILNPVLFLVGFYVFLVGSKILIALLVAVYRTRINDQLFRIINIILGLLLILISLKFFYDGYLSLTKADFL
jgi:threonine/homoserine/homoserine lactone efflux protein